MQENLQIHTFLVTRGEHWLPQGGWRAETFSMRTTWRSMPKQQRHPMGNLLRKTAKTQWGEVEPHCVPTQNKSLLWAGAQLP
jgi:hypothetical protein